MYAVREAFAAFRRAPVLTGLAAGMVGLALFVLGLFGLVTHNLQTTLDIVEERVEVIAYLREGATTAEVDAALDELRSVPEVRTAIYVSKAQALENARTELPEFEDVFSDLAVNPLPASLELELAEGYRNEETVEMISELAAAYPFVEDVRYGREWVEKLFSLRRIAGVAAGVLGAAFAAVAALIIGTALRIAIFARREEIYVMRLVGAKDGFIRRPFVLEGAIAGALGAVAAVGLTWATWRAVSSLIFEIEWIPGAWIGAGLGIGIVFGMLASSLAVRRHLREVA
ncbi:MAG TPA: permease-like cell division protein FtsX [Longimicrobiales bacterium]|nr:permease-like cell division protein FtsX [Longimicrobiales bacterium]